MGDAHGLIDSCIMPCFKAYSVDLAEPSGGDMESALLLLLLLFCLFALASTCIKQVYSLRLSCHKKRKLILSERAKGKDNDNEIQNTKKHNELNIRTQFKTKQSRAEVTNRSDECVGFD